MRDAIARVLPVERLRWVAFSHLEADECGAPNDFLAAAPDVRMTVLRLRRRGLAAAPRTTLDRAARVP